MLSIKHILKYLVGVLILISLPLWGKTELPVLPSTVAVKGLSLHINPQQSVYDANTGFSGAGTMFFPALGRELPVTYTNVRLDAQAQWQSGQVKAHVAPDLLKTSAIGDLEHPNVVNNFDGLKNFIKAARTHTDAMPLMLNTLPSFQNANFGTLAVMMTEINVSNEGTTASMMALERMPEGIYLPFTRTGIAFDPLSMQPFKELELALSATSDVPDTQMPITFKAGNATGTEGTYVAFDCNGLKVFHIEGFHKFTSGIITPSPTSGPAVIATFSADVKSVRQFVVKVTIPDFTIGGVDDVAFKITDAEIDYSDSENPTNFPAAYFTEMGNTAPTKKETWKGIHIGNLSISLPTLPMRDKDDKPFAFNAKDMIYDKGNGFSATLFVKTAGMADVNIKGFRMVLDEFNLRLKKNSVQDLNFLGSLAIPVLFDEKGALKYKATFNTSGDTTQSKFEVAVQFPDDINLQVPFLELAGCKLQKTSVVKIYNRSSKWGVFANLQGNFNIGVKKDSKLSLGLPFEGWKIGDSPTAKTRSGDEELPMGFKGFDLDGGNSSSAPSKKMSGFPLTVDDITFATEKGVYKLGMTVGIALGGSSSSFQAKGGIVISAGLQFSKLMTKKPWEGIEFKSIDVNELELNADMSTFSFSGQLKFMNDDTYGNGFKADVTLRVKVGKGFGVDAKAIFGNKDNYSYFYVDADFKFQQGVPLVSPLNLYSIGGGIYFNMRRVIENDKSKYIPQKDIFGFKARVGVGLQRRETFDAVGELQFEFGANWELRFFEIIVKAGMLNENVASIRPSDDRPYYASKFAGGCTLRYDNMNQTITVSAFVQLQNIPSVSGHAQLNMFFDLNDKGNWYVRLGTPQNPARITWLKMSVGMYVMLGKGVGTLPDIGTIVPELAGMGLLPTRNDPNKGNGPSATGVGFAFGMNYKMEQDFNFLLFSGGVKVAFGLDAVLMKSETCQQGWNGWLMQAQAYGYIGARVDLEVNLLFIKGKFNIATLEVGAVLRAQLPKPILLSGRVGARYSILGGLIKGRFSIGLELKEDGQPCTIDNVPKSPAVGQPLVADTYPVKNESIQVFDDIVVSTNFQVRQVQSYDCTGNSVFPLSCYYKVRLTKVNIMEGSKIIASLDSSDVVFKDDYTLVLTPRTALPPNAKLKLVIFAEAYDTREDGTIIKSVGTESREVEFKTKDRPDKVYTPMIAYSAPGTGQKYWYKGYAKPKVSLKQDGYKYLFEPNYNGIESEYKWNLYKKNGKDSTLVGSYNLSAAFNGDELFYTYGPNANACGTYTEVRGEYRNIPPTKEELKEARRLRDKRSSKSSKKEREKQEKEWDKQAEILERTKRVWVLYDVEVPKSCVYSELKPSRSFNFDALNTLDLEKKATYRIEVIRQPKGGVSRKKAEAATNVEANKVDGLDEDNEVEMTTRSLSIKKTEVQEVAIIYTNEFSISTVTDVAEKIKVSDKSQYETLSSFGQPNATDRQNMDGELLWTGVRPYVAIEGSVEPLDKYDTERIFANCSFKQTAGTQFYDWLKTSRSRARGMVASPYHHILLIDRYAELYKKFEREGLVYQASGWLVPRPYSYSARTYIPHPVYQFGTKLFEVRLDNFTRLGKNNVELVFNSVNAQWGMSEGLKIYAQNSKIATLQKPKCDDCYLTEDVMEIYNPDPLTQEWLNPSNFYNPGNYQIQGTFNYTATSIVPDRFNQPFTGTPKTYNFSFTPPNR